MATHYILAGGADVKNPDYWDDLHKVMPKNKQLHILSCQFSQAEEEWQERFESFKPFFRQAFGEDMTAELALADSFAEQAKKADVIYLHGGHTDWLKKHLEPYDARQLFKDKIVIGSSAGAQFLSTKYWTCGNRRVGDGMKLTPLNAMVHYNSDYGSDDPRGPIDWKAAKAELQKAIGNKEITLIPEGKFVQFTI